MALPLNLDELQDRIGYRFSDIRILERAVTHSSYSNETGAKNHHLLCNERLEFLGDAVLSLITSDYLYERFRDLPEGEMTRMREATVCEDALASYANKLELGEFLLLGKGETQNGGAHKPAILADAFEALLAAIYTDCGGHDAISTVSQFLLPFIKDAVDRLPAPGAADCKSKLQQFVQGDREEHELDYRIVSESGPDHNKTFVVELYLDSNKIGKGSGNSKKRAEQNAARDALRLFGEEV